MKITHTITAAIMAVTTLSQAKAADDYIATGVGVRTCAEFLQDHRHDPRWANMVYTSWAQGFMAGSNITMAAADKGYYSITVTADEIDRLLLAYCTDHPLENYMTGIQRLWGALGRRSYAR
jgi:hypothetical protein